MRQYFTPQELTDHFTMLPQEHGLLANKSGVNRLGFVVLFKYCQGEGRFPEHWQEVPRSLVQHIAATLDLPADEINTYDLAGRTARYHKEQIRAYLGFRPGTTTDSGHDYSLGLYADPGGRRDDTPAHRAPHGTI